MVSVVLMGRDIVVWRWHVSITWDIVRGLAGSSPSLFWGLKLHKQSKCDLDSKQARWFYANETKWLSGSMSGW